MRYYAAFAVLASITGGALGDATNIRGVDNSVTASLRARGYRIVPFTMRGSVEPGGEVMDFEGTIQEIESQIRQTKRDFTWDQFQPANPAPRQENINANGLQRRGPVAVTCPDKRDLGFGDRQVLEDAYTYFQNYTMEATNARPWDCKNFFARNDSQVLLCNSDIRNWSVMGVHAAVVMNGILSNDACEDPGDPGMVQGEANFEGQPWSIVFGGCNGSCME